MMFMMEKCLETPDIEVISRHLAVENSKPWGGLQRPQTPSCLGALSRFAASTANIIGVHDVWNVYCLLKLGCTSQKSRVLS